MMVKLYDFDRAEELNKEKRIRVYLHQVFSDGDADEMIRGWNTLPARGVLLRAKSVLSR
ncbi:MAG: hypothetical protein LBG61_05070 [Burkholderiales bacterium]|jgi:DNA-binding phage protein|nr:hypothetical protein [Burkholderiales bacterium]